MLLLIEPEETWQRMARETLSNEGHLYALASNLKEACNLLGIDYGDLTIHGQINKLRETPFRGVVTSLRFSDQTKETADFGLLIMEICDHLGLPCAVLHDGDPKHIKVATILAQLHRAVLIPNRLRDFKAALCKAIEATSTSSEIERQFALR